MEEITTSNYLNKLYFFTKSIINIFVESNNNDFEVSKKF